MKTRASSAEPGTVVAQDPGPGADVVRHSVVTLTVSAVQTEAVPNVVGKREAAAVNALRAQGFQVKTVSAVSKQAVGDGARAEPAGRLAGRSRLDRHAPRLARARDRAGHRRPVARRRRRGGPRSRPEAEGLHRALVAAEGAVVAQRPPAGKRVPGGSAVRLNVSSGSTGRRRLRRRLRRLRRRPSRRPSPCPDVTGQQQDVAQKQLNAAGLKAGVVYVASDEVQGTVVSQAPEGGTTQKRGTRIQLNVSLGPRAVVKGVPDVRNLDAGEARAKLTAAGFKVQTLPQGVSDPSQVGKVVDEQPAGGKNAPTGSVVTIYVGRAA